MKSTNKVFGTLGLRLCVIVLAAAVGFAVISCDNESTSSGPTTDNGIEVTLVSVTANGSAVQTTTQLTITFSDAVTGLDAKEISVGVGGNVTKGALTGSGTTYNLSVNVTKSGSIDVSVSKDGYTIRQGNKTVNVFYYTAPPIVPGLTFDDVTADGGAERTTRQLTLTFSEKVPGLSYTDIELSDAEGTHYVKGPVVGEGPVYTMTITGFSNSTEHLSVTALGKTIEVPIFVYKQVYGDGIAVDLKRIYTTTGDQYITTALYLEFDKEINGLGLDDIYFRSSGDITGLNKGNLYVPVNSAVGATYRLDISGTFNHNTELIVYVQKQGFAVTGDGTVYLYKPLERSLVRITATTPIPSGKNATPSFVLTFNDSIDGLVTGDIRTRGMNLNLLSAIPNGTNTSYTVAIDGITKPGVLTVDIPYKYGYRIDNLPQSVTIEYTVPAVTNYESFKEFLEQYTAAGETSLVTIKVAATLDTVTDFDAALLANPNVNVNLDLTGCALTRIAPGAFRDCKNLKNITLPTAATFTTIGNNAFNGSGITEIVIPKNVTADIGTNAFKDCDSLGKVTIWGGETTGNTAFAGLPALKEVIIGGSAANSIVEQIAASAFEGCGALESVTIGASITTIGDKAFKDCTSLSSITIPTTVTTAIPAITGGPPPTGGAFLGCTELKTVVINGGGAATGFGVNAAFAGLPITEVFIGGNANAIDANAFEGCTELTDVNIGATVNTTLGKEAFKDCTSLKNVALGGITSIGQEAFKDCGALEEIIIPTSVATIDRTSSTSPFDGTGLVKVTLNGPTSSTRVDMYGVFDEIETIETVIIGTGFTGILDQAFVGSTALSSITITGTNAKFKVYKGVLYEVLSTTAGPPATETLKIVTFPVMKNIDLDFTLWTDSFTSTGNNPTTTITSSTVEIAKSAFKDTGITSLTINSALTAAIPTGGVLVDPFEGCTSLTTLTVNASQSDAINFCYHANDSLRNTVTDLTIGKVTLGLNTYMVETIVNENYGGLAALERITFKDGMVTSIGNGAFTSLANLETVTFEGTDIVITDTSSFPFNSWSVLPAYDFLKDAYRLWGTGTYKFETGTGWTKEN